MLIIAIIWFIAIIGMAIHEECAYKENKQIEDEVNYPLSTFVDGE